MEERVPEGINKSGVISAEQEIKVLSEISVMVQGSPAEKSSFEEILKHLGKIIDFRSASLFLSPKRGDKLEEVCTVGRRVDLIDFVNFDMGSGISAWVAKHGRAIVLNNLRKSKGGTHTKSFISVPMVFAKEIIGVINLSHDEPGSFSKRDAEVVSVAGSMMALLAERISHEQLLAEKAAEVAGLEQKLEAVSLTKIESEKVQISGISGASLSQKLSNPLAIISGNAQFLIMTLKTANPSIIKRLKAIDKEAGNIADLSRRLLDPPGNTRINRLFDSRLEETQVGS
jgi:transcriptional regulator with GAF, ATPase, and Fis domain